MYISYNFNKYIKNKTYNSIKLITNWLKIFMLHIVINIKSNPYIEKKQIISAILPNLYDCPYSELYILDNIFYCIYNNNIFFYLLF